MKITHGEEFVAKMDVNKWMIFTFTPMSGRNVYCGSGAEAMCELSFWLFLNGLHSLKFLMIYVLRFTISEH
jgi:hypothetical protein